METETGRKVCSGTVSAVTARAASLVAVGEVARGAVVAGADDAEGWADEDGADASFHAVGAERGERGKSHEVHIPGGAEAGGVGQVEGAEGSVEGAQDGGGVDEAEVGA